MKKLSFLFVVLALVGFITLSACKNSSQPAEEVEDTVEEVMDEAQDSAEEVMEDMEEGAEDVQEAADEAME